MRARVGPLLPQATAKVRRRAMGTGTNGGNFKREVRLMIVTTNVYVG